jgi:hypothetical protein
MKHPKLMLFLGLLAPVLPVLGVQDADKLVFPDPAHEIWIVRSSPANSTLPAGTRLPESDPLAAKILAELRLPFHHSVIKLSQCSRNLAGRNKGPNVLYLSGNEGGFPRHGLALRNGNQTIEFPDLNYVDLVLDDKAVAAGDLSIYSHELGHVMMFNIWEHFPERESVKQHVSMGVTDRALAFLEGWGEHFQRLAYDAIPRYQIAFRDGFDFKKSTRSLWHSLVDEELRIDGVLRNDYIWQKMTPAAGPEALNLEQSILLEHTSPIFDRTRLKNAQQMLACEGILATLFYRLDTSPVLRDHYAAPSFYERFLLSPIPAGQKANDIFTPFENVMLKNFWVWHRLNEKAAGGTAIILEFLKEWAESFPQDKDEIWGIFLATTAGQTVSRELGRVFEETALYGMIGDYQRYTQSAGAYKKALAEWTAKVLTGTAAVDACVGPEIWVTNKNFLVRTTLWSEEGKKPLRIDLNTCSAFDLMTFPGLTAEKAATIIAAREKSGFFRSLDDARRRGFDPGAF